MPRAGRKGLGGEPGVAAAGRRVDRLPTSIEHSLEVVEAMIPRMREFGTPTVVLFRPAMPGRPPSGTWPV
ncbi:MAG: hypothetical protein AAF628_01490 [Planctomycetota bacterium]